jgi:O-antigen/teichoic acid export membrane protein
MLSRYAGVSIIPIYEMVFQGSMQFRGLIEAGFRALMPESSRVSAKITSQSIGRMTMLNRRAIKLIAMLGIPMYTVAFISATFFLKIWLGDKFIPSIPLALRIMLIASFVNLLGVPSYYFLLGMGHARDVLVSRCISWLINMALIVLIAVSTNHLSVTVICVCLIISWSLSSTYIIWRFRRRLTEAGALLQQEMEISNMSFAKTV